MKKIVALVLAMVMVMGLATVASAATFAQGDVNDAVAVTGKTAEVKAAVPASEAVKSFATYQIYVTNTADKSVVVEGPFAEVAVAEQAAYTFVDGTVIRYFAAAETYTKVVKAVKIENKTVYACGDLQVAATGTYYVDADGVYYKADAAGTVVGNVDGKMVKLSVDATIVPFPHDYVVETKTVGAKTEVTGVSCKACKASFAFVEGTTADAVAKFGAGKYAAVPANVYANLFVAKAAGASAPAAGETVESAKTFDAGIAMYVGMSVMAAAGSAVVLKKKD